MKIAAKGEIEIRGELVMSYSEFDRINDGLEEPYKNPRNLAGNGAVKEAELNTSKTSEIHKICTLTAIAMCVSKDEVDEVCVAAGIPVKEWENVEKRAEYKAYIFPKGEISLKIMDSQLNPMPCLQHYNDIQTFLLALIIRQQIDLHIFLFCLDGYYTYTSPQKVY